MHLNHSIQTLTTLNILCNQIGNKGTEYLANALKRNTVRLHSCLLIANTSKSINADTYRAAAYTK
jgi:hypothetical protein